MRPHARILNSIVYGGHVLACLISTIPELGTDSKPIFAEKRKRRHSGNRALEDNFYTPVYAFVLIRWVIIKNNFGIY